jgi:hypothetical protein
MANDGSRFAIAHGPDDGQPIWVTTGECEATVWASAAAGSSGQKWEITGEQETGLPDGKTDGSPCPDIHAGVRRGTRVGPRNGATRS